MNKPSPTINTITSTYYHPIENRYLTAREASALQSYPSDYKFFGSRGSQFTQIGNSVPPILAEEIGKGILKMEKYKEKETSNEKRIDLERLRSYAFRYDKDPYQEGLSQQLTMNI